MLTARATARDSDVSLFKPSSADSCGSAAGELTTPLLADFSAAPADRISTDATQRRPHAPNAISRGASATKFPQAAPRTRTSDFASTRTAFRLNKSRPRTIVRHPAETSSDAALDGPSETVAITDPPPQRPPLFAGVSVGRAGAPQFLTPEYAARLQREADARGLTATSASARLAGIKNAANERIAALREDLRTKKLATYENFYDDNARHFRELQELDIKAGAGQTPRSLTTEERFHISRLLTNATVAELLRPAAEAMIGPRFMSMSGENERLASLCVKHATMFVLKNNRGLVQLNDHDFRKAFIASVQPSVISRLKLMQGVHRTQEGVVAVAIPAVGAAVGTAGLSMAAVIAPIWLAAQAVRLPIVATGATLRKIENAAAVRRGEAEPLSWAEDFKAEFFS